MRIARVEISNWRSIRSISFEPSQICALIGPNNSGKSNILSAISTVLGRDWVSVNSFSEDDVYRRDPENDINILLAFDPPIDYRKYKKADPTQIASLSFEYTRYKIGDSKGRRRLDQKCYGLDGKPPQVLSKAPRKGEQRQYEPLVNIPSDVRMDVPLIYIGTNRSLKEQLPSARYSLLRQLLGDINEELNDPETTITVPGGDAGEIAVPRLDRFRDLLTSAFEVLRTESFQQLEESIKRNAIRQLGFDPDIDPNKLDFFFSPFCAMDFYKALDLMVREGDFSISASQLGEGIQNVLVLAILQAFAERRKQGAIFLIEEPEMFLHPQMQRSVYKTIREIGKTNQVIYTTHSPYFVTVPDYDEVVLVRKDNMATYVKRSGLPATARRREKLIKEFDPERNELFFASRLLLVEGDTEKLALPEYAKRLGLDLDLAGASIVEVGGKRNLLEFARIAGSFEIPTAVLYDEDSSDIEDSTEESNYNEKLEALVDEGPCYALWSFSKKYEDHLRKAIGEQAYLDLCQKFPSVSKATRARLIAAEDHTAIPAPIEDVLNWLVGES